MPEFFLELFSEEIPARMQRVGAAQLETQLMYPVAGGITIFHELQAKDHKTYYGPRRIAISADLVPETPESEVEIRGPRDNAPPAALQGFLAKNKASSEQLVVEGGYYVLRQTIPAIPAKKLLEDFLPMALAKISWPKSMRWGQSGEFAWVRPLRRILCLLDGEVVPIKLGPIVAGNETEGHRVHAPGAFAVTSAKDWEEKLRAHYVIADLNERRRVIADGIAQKAAAWGLSVAVDAGLLDEVTGLVEWPVPLIGAIDDEFMELPPEVRELSMKVNQKYFALRDANGNPAPYFAFVANLEASDGGAAIIAGNERVLRARLSDARHFWELDLKTPLKELLPKLEKITFHAKIGSQRERAERIADLAARIAEALGANEAERAAAHEAGLLCKADLVTGMVGEFPELQGVMGGYYAQRRHDGDMVGLAIKMHYQPKGPGDAVPTGTVAVSVALADKLDTLREFFRIGEKPTGSGDPYALRRAALGVIRIILENELRLPLWPLLGGEAGLFEFIIERLRVKLRGEGKRFDVLDAVLAAPTGDKQLDTLRIIGHPIHTFLGVDDDLVRLMKRVDALGSMLGTEDGHNLLTVYKRAANILRIEKAKHREVISGPPDSALFEQTERELDHVMLEAAGPNGLFKHGIATEDFGLAMRGLARMRRYIDAFFERVTVNDAEPEIRLNRLRLLAKLRDTMHLIADFSKIEG